MVAPLPSLVGTGLKVDKAGNNWWLRSPGNNDD